MLFRSVLALFCLLVPASAFAAFGLVTAADSYTVDTGAGLVFKVRRTNNGSNTQSPGDLMSLSYNGVEYQDTSRGSQVNSGFDYLYNGVSAVSVSASVVNTNYIRITVTAGSLTHYYLARNGYPHVYMATHFTAEPDTLGLCRYIVRIPRAKLPNGPIPSDIHLTTSTVEASDIFAMSDGTTRSKHYSNMRLKDWRYIGATGTNVGVWMVRDNNEGNSGGPFYRCLLNQCGDDQEITYIVNYGEEQTEAFRTGVLNSYTLVFTNGAAPGTPDVSWFANMGLTGYVSAASRGAVTCAGITGLDTGYAYTVGFANSTAQYWTDAASGTGAFTLPGMIPGTYTLSVYKNELAVYTASVTVTAGSTATVAPITITADPSTVVPLWRIGNWDGTPNEFLHADQVTTMHPSDVRITPAGSTAGWNLGTYIVGTSSPASGIPCYQWKDVNGPQTVQFNLTAAQITASTVRIGITTAFAGARPKISVNSWQSGNPNPSDQPDTRTLTVGSYRGNNTTYSFAVPASALIVGTNTLTFFPISGTAGSGYLSPGYSLDCVDIYQGAPQTLAVPAAPASLTATGGDKQITLNWSAAVGAASYNVWRAAVSGGPYVRIVSGIPTPGYTDTHLINGTAYYYQVSASNSSGTGLNSNEVAGTPNGRSLVAYLKFDEASGVTAVDASGNGWNGALASGAAWAAGKVNNAVSLSGVNSYVSLPPGVMSGVNDFTIAGWVRVDSPATWSRILDFGTGTTNYMFLTPQSYLGKPRFAINTGSGEQSIDSTAALPSGVWTHVAVTLSGGTGTLYLNGLAAGVNNALTLKPSNLGNTTRNYLGKSQFNDPYLNGGADDFRLYDRALTATEITILAGGYAGRTPAVAHWNFEEGAADTYVPYSPATAGSYDGSVLDVSGNGNHLSPWTGNWEWYRSAVPAATTPGTGMANTRSVQNANTFPALSAINTSLTTWSPTAWTIEAAIRPDDANNGYQTFVGRDSQGAYAAVPSLSALYFSVRPNGVLAIQFTDAAGYNWQLNSAANAVASAKWQAVAATSDGRTLSLYARNLTDNAPAYTLLGTLDISSSPNPALSTGAGDGTDWDHGVITVGRGLFNGAHSDRYFGYLDDVRLSEAALAPDTLLYTIPPPVPGNLSAATASATQINLSWNASAGATRYNVKRATVSSGPYSIIASNTTTASYSNSGLAAGTTYYYVVSAENAAGQSADSIQASATTWTASQAWRQTYFGTTSDTGNAAPMADPDGDALLNIWEYAYGTDPKTRTTDPLSSQIIGRRLTLTFPRNTAATDVTLTVAGADSPAGPWTELARSTAGAAFTATATGATASETGVGTTRNVQVGDVYLVGDPAHPRRFMRLRVEQ